ncbi:MAG: sigma 54-interacting transcriptional regulator [Acidobacteriota bacterium]
MQSASDRSDFQEMLCSSTAMRRVYELVARVGPTDLDVLITGEPGVGKEVIARRIHGLSKRSAKPLLKVDSGRLEALLSVGRLLGVKPFLAWSALACGAGSTLYFDEIGELDVGAQAAILQLVLDRDSQRVGDGRFFKPAARILASTCRNLREEVTAGRFREDLYRRLNAVEITVPPLRDRPEDIAALADFFRREFEEEHTVSPVTHLRRIHLEALAASEWPENVRDLREFVDELMRAGGDPTRAIEDRQRRFERNNGTKATSALSLGQAARLTSEAVERRMIVKALEESGGDRKRAARKLNISYRALLGKIRSLQIVS